MRAAFHTGVVSALVLGTLWLAVPGRAAAAPRAPAPPRAPASSPPGERGDAAMADAARLRLNEGIKLYGKKKYDRAMAAFFQAYALTRTATVLLNLGMTSLKMGEWLRAVRFFERFLKDAPDATADQKTRAQNGIVEARRSLGKIDVIAVEGAELTVDGESVGRAPLPEPLDVLPGRHEVTSTAPAGSKSETVEVSVGALVKVRLGVPGPPASPPNAVLEPEPRAPPGAIAEPPSSPSTAEGDAPGTFSPPVTIAPVYVAGAIGLVALTAAIVFRGIGANADRNTSVASEALTRSGKDPNACTSASGDSDPSTAGACSTLRSAERVSASVQTPFVITLGVGAGATLFALAWYFFAPKSSAPAHDASVGRERPRLAPRLGPRGEPGAALDLTF